MIVISGVDRVDVTKVAAVLGEPVEKADPHFVRYSTGYAIGGVAPVGRGVALPAGVFGGIGITAGAKN